MKQKFKQLKEKQKFCMTLGMDDIIRIKIYENWSKTATVKQKVVPRTYTAKTMMYNFSDELI